MKLTIADKTLTLTYNMFTWSAIESASGKRWHELVQDLDDPKCRVESMMVLLFGLAQDETLTPDWIKANMKPTEDEFGRVCAAIIKAIEQGMKMEKDDDGPVDVGLEEIKKNEAST